MPQGKRELAKGNNNIQPTTIGPSVHGLIYIGIRQGGTQS